MLQHIIKIIWNERHANFLIWLELLVVSVCLLYLADFGVTKAWIYTRPMGIDTHKVANITFEELYSKHPNYVPREVDSTPTYDAITTLLQRIEQHPDVEALCYCFSAFPYHGNSQTSIVRFRGTKSPEIEDGSLFIVSPSYVEVFRLQNATGTEQELKDVLENGFTIPSESVAEGLGVTTKELLNRNLVIEFYGDSILSDVKCVVRDMRRNEIDVDAPVILRYEKDVLRRLLSRSPQSLQYGLRIKEGAQITPRELFQELRPQLQVANWRVRNITPIEAMKEQSQAAFFNSLKLNAIYMSFLLICIFLGVIGTFWYRTQQRRAQMGLRLAMGETPIHLLGMYLTEGLLLLLTTLPLSIPAYCLFSAYGVLEDNFVTFFWRGPLTFLVAYAILALLTLLAIWIPTRGAVRLSPALSIHEE